MSSNARPTFSPQTGVLIEVIVVCPGMIDMIEVGIRDWVAQLGLRQRGFLPCGHRLMQVPTGVDLDGQSMAMNHIGYWFRGPPQRQTSFGSSNTSRNVVEMALLCLFVTLPRIELARFEAGQPDAQTLPCENLRRDQSAK